MVRSIGKWVNRSAALFGVLAIALMVAGCVRESPIAAVTPVPLESAEIRTNQVATLPTAVPAPDAVGQTVAEQPGVITTLNDADYTPVPPAFPTEPPLPTIPVMEQIPRGQALQQAKKEDIAREIQAPNPITFDTEPVPLRFDEFFVDFDPFSIEPPTLSDKLLSLDGKQVVIEGYMAPPLKLGLDWFMLTGFPMGFCPFHSSAATITPDIALIYVEGPELQYFYEPLRIEGELHLGESVDWQTGMVSLVRIYTSESSVEAIQLGSQ